MTILKSFCCLSNVRSGSIACGVYSLMLSIIDAGLEAYYLRGYMAMHVTRPGGENNLSNLTVNHSINVPANNSGVCDEDLPIQSQNVFQTIFLVAACLLLCTSVFLIIGVSLDKKSLLVPWLSVMVINVVLDTGIMVYQTTLVSCVADPWLIMHTSFLYIIIIEMAILLLLTVLNIYCILCVFSQYQELKAGRGTREYVRRNSTRINYQRGSQHAYAAVYAAGR